ncbi:hypothetical protein [Cognatishimia activa]|uniref:hypothetical protein n=1 Tax=Cognatishimia activa TaxID=1715691 RepID=UPI0006EEE0AD|nr:hypothetical protein [Cognatishimia activa]CUJ29981.1 hypothetical protein TA5113_02941 [Cognatishimia activa]
MSISERDFNTVAAASPKKRDAPFSLRLSFEEKTELAKMAAGEPLGAYIKAVLFDEARTGVRRSKTPAREGQAVGRALGDLGKSRLSQNLNQLAKAVNMGALPVTPETEAEIQDACRAVKDMRDALMDALKDGGAP